MTRNMRTAVAILGAILSAGCGSADDSGGAGTEATSRSLLNRDVVLGPSTPVEADAGLTARATRAYIPELGHDMGSKAAPLKLIEFSDFGCGYCRRFHMETFPTLRADFVETERIEWKFMPFISGMFENSMVVTEAAECALEQGSASFEALGDRLWQRQPEWKPSDQPEALVRAWAGELGVDLPRFDACMAEDRRVERVAGATVVAEQLGIRGTPTFWLVGYGPLQGALPLEAFQGILGAVLDEIEAGGSALADSAAAS